METIIKEIGKKIFIMVMASNIIMMALDIKAIGFWTRKAEKVYFLKQMGPDGNKYGKKVH